MKTDDVLDENLKPTYKFLFSCCHFNTNCGSLVIPAHNIEYVYETVQGTVLVTKNGGSRHLIVDDVLRPLRYNEVDCEKTKCSDCEFHNDCEIEGEND